MTEDMMMGERDLEVELKEKDEIIMSLRLNEHLLKDKLEISRRNMGKQLERIKELEKKNEQLRKDVENLQEVVAELGATLLVNGFEIEINGENLSELIDDE